MGNNEYNNQQQSVITIAQVDGQLRAVELRSQHGTFEVLWTKSSAGGVVDWQTFAAECGLSINTAEQLQMDSDKTAVIGCNSAGIAFYNINIPTVENSEIEAMVRMQAESQLPLPANQMELAWRSRQVKGNQLAITMAASRRQHLQVFIDKVKSFQPEKIILDSEAVVEAWRTLFSGKEQKVVIISAGSRNTQVCFSERGQLSNAVSLDMGIDDFVEGEIENETETTERFVQDIRSMVEMFGSGKPTELPVTVLSDGSQTYVSLAYALKHAGLNTQVALPIQNTLTAKEQLSVQDLYCYRVPIGLALMTLKPDVKELDIFERLYNPAGDEEEKHLLCAPKVAYTIAAVVAALFIIVVFAVDMASPGAIEKRLSESGSQSEIEFLIERQTLIKTTAANRPDILDLINEIDSSGQSNLSGQRGGRGGRGGTGQGSGIQIESFVYKTGTPVQITGQVSGSDALYQFEQKLEEKTDIQDVKRSVTQGTASSAASRGGGTGRSIQFTITFHYKNFTR